MIINEKLFNSTLGLFETKPNKSHGWISIKRIPFRFCKYSLTLSQIMLIMWFLYMGFWCKCETLSLLSEKMSFLDALYPHNMITVVGNRQFVAVVVRN